MMHYLILESDYFYNLDNRRHPIIVVCSPIAAYWEEDIITFYDPNLVRRIISHGYISLSTHALVSEVRIESIQDFSVSDPQRVASITVVAS
jgi:hypothetical protein